MFRKLVVASALFLSPYAASAAAIITDGNVSLGVDDLGQLNIRGGVADVTGQTIVGERWIDPNTGIQYESTSHGCLCEGWGVSVNGSTAGYANNAAGTAGLSLVSFTSTATTATSVTEITGTGVTVTHSFALSDKTDDLYRVSVTITNTSAAAVSDVTYRRAMDWDTSPTPFDEYVTIQGTATTTLLKASSDNGFASSNPLLTSDVYDRAGCGLADFTACGPADHGSVFDFDFGTLESGESYTFDIFYGGAANKADALAALGSVGAELYSLGWSYLDPDQDGFSAAGAVTPTYIFAFKGVGGTVIVPPPTSTVPVPAAGFLLVAGLGALAATRRRKA
ncbi:MAG: VPLPA-CTERM sorting domain-containing protein [Paracoccaceae bacterium]